ncbi:hypothetical protein PSMA106859_07060 [Pseudoalteromonas maricaloris]
MDIRHKKPTVVGLFISLFYHLRKSGGRRTCVVESGPPTAVILNFRNSSQGNPAPTWILDTKKLTFVGLFISLFYHLRKNGGYRTCVVESEPPSAFGYDFRRRSQGKPAPTWILDTKKPTFVGLFLSLFLPLEEKWRTQDLCYGE